MSTSRHSDRLGRRFTVEVNFSLELLQGSYINEDSAVGDMFQVVQFDVLARAETARPILVPNVRTRKSPDTKQHRIWFSIL
jgi:hypothetical protein